MPDVYTGIFYINPPTIGVDVHLPSCTKATGNGYGEADTATLDEFG